MKISQGLAMKTRRLERLVSIGVLFGILLLSWSTYAKEVSIEFWHGITGSDYEGIKELVDRFNQEYAGRIYVEEVPMAWGTLYDKVQISVASGVAPDVGLIHKDHLAQKAEMGLLRVLDDLWNEAGWTEDDFLPGVANGAVYNDAYYAVPLDIYTHALFYNKGHLDEAGIGAPPSNPDEYVVQAKKLTKRVDGKTERWGTNTPKELARFYNVLWQHGGDIYDQDGTTVILNSPEARSAMEFVADMIFSYQVAPPLPYVPNMWNGEVSLNIAGLWDLRIAQQMREESTLDLQVASMDSLFGDARRGLRVGSHEIVIFNQLWEDADRMEAAKIFVRFLSDSYSMTWTEHGHLPVKYEAIGGSEFASLKDHQKLINQVFVYIPSPPWGVGGTEFDSMLNRAFNPAHKDFTSVDNALIIGADQFRNLVKSYVEQ